MERSCDVRAAASYEKHASPRILLVAPTALDFHGHPIRERRLHLPALTLPLLAALTPPEVEVKLIYETVEDIPFNEHWDLVGLTGMGSGLVRAWEIADRFRASGTKVVVGGIAASGGRPEDTLKHADAVAIGEAESIWPHIVEDALNGILKREYHGERTATLDHLPVPRYELMNPRKIGLWRPVQATRGCPHQCCFCSVTSFMEGSYRKRPVSQVVRDVRAAKRNGSRHIAFVDDNISADADYCAELWEALIPEKIIWMSQCTLQLADDPALLRLARRSGCRLVSVGIESTNPENLSQINKAFNDPGGYAGAIERFRRHGIEVSTEMIIGFDGDGLEVFEHTRRFIMENRITVPRVHILTPAPGTPLFRSLEQAGRILNYDFSQYTGSKVNFLPRRIDCDTLRTEYWKLYEQLFKWGTIARRLIPAHTRPGFYMRLVIWAANIRYRGHIRERISPGIL
jgi:radical SAM superfamily enzyme YgiQ (UPF0313 family)